MRKSVQVTWPRVREEMELLLRSSLSRVSWGYEEGVTEKDGRKGIE